MAQTGVQHSNFDINIQSQIQTYKRVKKGTKPNKKSSLDMARVE